MAAILNRLSVFLDADVLMAGFYSHQGASFIVMKLADLTLINGLASEQVLTEATRNLETKLPDAMVLFKALVDTTLTVVPNPTAESVRRLADQADPKDVPILTAAVLNDCRFLITFNTRHYWPHDNVLTVMRPGDFVFRLRE